MGCNHDQALLVHVLTARRTFIFWCSIILLLHNNFYSNHVVESAQLGPGLSDPSEQPIFVENAPNALHPNNIAQTAYHDSADTYNIAMGVNADHFTGLVQNGKKVRTTIFGYGQCGSYTWPGPTFEVISSRADGPEDIYVTWTNELRQNHILPVDTTLHWAFSLEGYEDYTIEEYGVPTVPHLHGGFTDYEYDGHSEAFFTPDATVVGPFWDVVEDGFTNVFKYDNRGKANPSWYHDHALGLTRLNVYAGLAGFFIVRDELDTGKMDNPLGLPAGEYELAYAIQDRMFTKEGDLFYPAFPGDPTYADYIDGEGAILPDDQFPDGGPTAVAEFFGDHIVVNGKLWPKADVKPREYRLRLLNGCDSRFFVIQFVVVEHGIKDPTGGTPLAFTVIGSDDGLGTPKKFTEPLIFEPAARYDIIIDFSKAAGKRVILQNLGGDAPFGGSFGNDLSPEDFFEDRQTDKIMAFDVADTDRAHNQRFDGSVLPEWHVRPRRKRSRLVRHLALFEGKDNFGRLQPVLGSATDNSASDSRGLFAAYTWFQATTENPRYMTTEEWYLINFTEDAHSMHLHLVNFEVVSDFTFTYELDGDQEVQLHMGGTGTAPKVSYISDFELVERDSNNYYDKALRDVVTVLPGDPALFQGRGTIIRMKFDKIGIYSWHCHILAHEDHEMMRRFEVIPNEKLMYDDNNRHHHNHNDRPWYIPNWR